MRLITHLAKPLIMRFSIIGVDSTRKRTNKTERSNKRMPERSRIYVRIEHDITLVRWSGKGVVCDDHNASPPLLCHIHKVDCDWMGLSETHRQDDVTSAATRHPRHIRLRSVTSCPRIRPQQLHQVGGMLHHGTRSMKCYSYHATGFSQCGHRTVEGIQSVLGDGLLQTQPIGTEAPGENILLNHKQKWIVMDYRPGVRSQSMLVTNSLLKGRISTESQRLRKPDTVSYTHLTLPTNREV